MLAHGEHVQKGLGGVLVRPSPALITEASTCLANRWGAPAMLWRMIIMSGDMAMRVLAVSMRVSPLVMELVEADKETVSALKRLAATSKLVRVRVLASWKKFTASLPRRVGTFLMGRALIRACARRCPGWS